MSIKNESNLKSLMKLWPSHTALPVAWLLEKGFSRSLVQRYISSGWMESLGHGAVKKPDDSLDWSGMLWGVQQLSPCHVGGKTALELQGKSHFVKFQDTKIFVFSRRGFRLPKWLGESHSGFNFINVPYSLFSSDVGVSLFSFGDFSLKVSNSARAFCEYVYLMDRFHSHDEAYYLMENLQFLTPDLMQEALEECQSIKVKRLVLCLGKRLNVQWYPKLDLSRLELGKGPRQGVSNGAYDSEYQITYPRVWRKEENESIF